MSDPPRHLDEEMLASISHTYGAPLYRFALRLTGDPQQSEEIVQDTLLRAWRHPESLSRDGEPSPAWLFTVARNLAHDAHRRQRARPVGVPLADGPGEPGSLEEILDVCVVQAALEQLSQAHRDVLLHCVYLNRPVAEAASLLGLPQGTVKSRTYYALRALRLALDELGFHG